MKNRGEIIRYREWNWNDIQVYGRESNTVAAFSCGESPVGLVYAHQ